MRFLFVRSDGKLKRDRKRRQKHRAKIETEINLLKEKVGMPYYRNPQKLQAKIDKLCKRYPEGRYLQIELVTSDGKAISLEYTWEEAAVSEAAVSEAAVSEAAVSEAAVSEAAVSEAAKWDGIYLLGTTLMEHPMGEVFGLFKEQHYAESANKDLKGPLRIRPIFLQNQARIEALIFILFLALMVYMVIERWDRNRVTEPKLRKTTTRTLLKVFRNYALTVLVSEDGIQEVPNSLTMTQQAVFSVLGLNFSDIYQGFT